MLSELKAVRAMSVRFWIAAVFTVSMLSFLVVPCQCQSTEDTVEALSSTSSTESSANDTSNNATVQATVNNGSNSSGPAPSSGWNRLLRKFFDRPSSQQKHADKNRIILENLNNIQANPETANTTSSVAFHDEETVAIITYVNKNVNSCKLMEVNYHYQAVEVLKNLSVYMPIYPVDTRTMVNLIKQCQYLRGPVESNGRGWTSRSMRSENSTSSSSWTTFVTTIVPGTKWCGPGDVAQSYDDLGALMEVDKCCRAHDHCPIKVKGFASAHGLMNLSFYTKSHCACDDEFFSCLKALPTPVSRMIGNLYFNVIQMPCVDELQLAVADGLPKPKLEILQPELCTAKISRSGECTGPSVRRPFQPRPYKFVTINRVF